MIRRLARWSSISGLCLAGVLPVGAQAAPQGAVDVVKVVAAVSTADLHGTVRDENDAPIQGAVVSAFGEATAFAISDAAGRFVFRNLPPGPYFLRAHLRGFQPAAGRMVRLNPGSGNVWDFSMARREDGDAGEELDILEAGAAVTRGGTAPAAAPAGDATGGGRDADTSRTPVAWRLRHMRRSILHDEGMAAAVAGSNDAPESRRRYAALSQPAASLFAELPMTGQVNLLTRATFDRPEDILTTGLGGASGVAFLSLAVPTTQGDWAIKGALTQGDVSSWVVTGSYTQRVPSSHQYEAGLSYAMQRYLGGNGEALGSVANGRRNIGAVQAFDRWTLDPRLSLSYGARYAVYDYLDTGGLLSPRFAVTVEPIDGDRATLTATFSRTMLAPGAEEFVPPVTGLLLPPERTFSPVASGNGFSPERTEHLELSGERDVLNVVMVDARVFRQSVDDQIVTLFGLSPGDLARSPVGHYYVGSAGGFDAVGFGLGVSRAIAGGLRGGVRYTRARATWSPGAGDQVRLSETAPATVRSGSDTIHDLTMSVEGEVPGTSTRVLVLYRLNESVATGPLSAGPSMGSRRFNVQVTQSLPFLAFTSAQWEMLVAVRNQFREANLPFSSLYDEVLVVRPPTQLVGGLTVRF
ncbi:MAG: TonB-dependent receptor [Vicinamibacterales bacterium]